MTDQSNIQSAACKSIRPFKSSEEYLYAMKEDLAEWLHSLYDLDVTVDTFLQSLETGCTLCVHANAVNSAARLAQPTRAWPDVAFQQRGAVAGSFVARDNVSNFIRWCRSELCVPDVLMFETNDLVERGSEKNVVLCLLEVARRGARFGVPAPVLVQLEEEIAREESREREREKERERERENKKKKKKNEREEDKHQLEEQEEEEEYEPPPRRVCDMRNLDELLCSSSSSR
ncbi:GAS2-like protein 1 [Hoplias malabaricus]|uniref:GAS2-like protein 1 n=1 Tax=Hoplias malabaricus TaxID=27720 RepID=UPI003462CD05